VGGAVAAGLSGPRRAAVGSLRDFVLGVKLMDGEGRVHRFGGEVMKNVAGFDVSRLLTGSLGTLGLILEVSLKVLPLPVGDASLRFEMPQDKALEALNRWAGSRCRWSPALAGRRADHPPVRRAGGGKRGLRRARWRSDGRAGGE
jgi:glycolate oxidase FAD binding subunit